jgi:hypothetical protein
MATIKLDVKVNDKGAARAISRVIAALQGAPLKAAVLAGAEEIRNEAVQRAPVETGALRRNIRVEG